MSEIVVDSSAVLALLLDEPGAGTIAARLSEAAISSVNVTEVISRLLDTGRPEGLTVASIGLLALRIVDFDGELAIDAALLRRATKPFGLSLGDRACLATAGRLGLPALTCDRNWRNVDVGVEIQLAR